MPLAGQDQLAKDKTEFQLILKSHQEEKSKLESDRAALGIEKNKVTARPEQIGHFIQAVQRDITVLGL